ncbi:MarR family transcriptional regulator [Streptomyces sp. NPDC051684]|uniref:MarR family transcriptional regulator n=1 Tax=Streptomyces sp. NPDC051684 TaxID=3365670 RepID=UPI00379AFBDE
MYKRVMDPGGPSAAAPRESLIVSVEELVRHVRRSAVTGGLSTAASAALARLGREGPQRLTDLARAEGASQPNMSQLVSRLERAGLVRRTADHSDGRSVLVDVTDSGMEVFRQRRAERDQALNDLVGELTEAEQAAVRLALPALARVIQERHRRP